MTGSTPFSLFLKPISIITLLSGLVFCLLLGFRLGLFRSTEPIDRIRPSVLSAKESWMNILQKGRKIGYAHRRLTPRGEGYDLNDSTRIKINTMGMIQDVSVRTVASLNSDLSLDAFTFDLRSSLFHFKVRGKREKDRMMLFADGKQIEIPIKEGLHLTTGILDAVSDMDMQENESRRLSIFDPTTLSQRPVLITMEGKEQLEIMGARRAARKLRIDFMGTTQYAWIDRDGSVLQEDGLMGIRLQRATRSDALDSPFLTPGPDLAKMVSVLPVGSIPYPLQAKQLQLKITGLTDTIQLRGGRQAYEDGVLTISKEDAPSRRHGTIPAPNADHTTPTLWIQSDHPKIRAQVSLIVSMEDSMTVKAERIMDWIHEEIEKRPVLSVPNALETLENRRGDCNEHAVLMAAMARAAGIPAQIEAGLVFLNGRFYYHAWNALYLGGWVTADALMGQLPADVTHIRLVRGGMRDQIDLMGVIGNVGIEVLEPIE